MRTAALVLFLLVMGLAIGASPSLAATGVVAKGVAAYDRGDYDTAIALLDQASRANPRDPAARCWLGVAYAQKASWYPKDTTLKSLAVTSLEATVRLDKRGAWGRTAAAWLKRLRGSTSGVALGAVEASRLPREYAQDLRAQAADEVRRSGLRLVYGAERDSSSSRAAAKRKGARWYVSMQVTRWSVDEPTSEQIRAYEEARQKKGFRIKDFLKTAACSVDAEAAVRVSVVDLTNSSAKTSFKVAASESEVGHGDDIRKSAEEKTVRALPVKVAERLQISLGASGGSGVTQYVDSKGQRSNVPYVSVPLAKCYGIAGIPSVAEAKRLPIITVAPFAVSTAATGNRSSGQLATDAVARQLLRTGRYTVIAPRDFAKLTGVGSTSYFTPEGARTAGRKVGASFVVVGNVEKVESWVRQAFLGKKRIASKAELKVRVLSCGQVADRPEQVYRGEAQSSSAGVSSDDARDAPDLVAVTQRPAIDAAAAVFVKSFVQPPPRRR